MTDSTLLPQPSPYPPLMPRFSAGLVRDFDLCECNWKDCAAIQEKIARHCVESEENDVALGFVKITATESNNRLRGRIKKLLGYQPKNGKQDSDYIVARHHWNRHIVGITEKEESLDGPMAVIVNGMWTTHTEIFQNKKYIERCYPDIVQLKNRGKKPRHVRRTQTRTSPSNPMSASV